MTLKMMVIFLDQITQIEPLKYMSELELRVKMYLNYFQDI